MVPFRSSVTTGSAHSLPACGDMDPNANPDTSFEQPRDTGSLQDQMNQVVGMPTQQAHRFASFKEHNPKSERKRRNKRYEMSCANCLRTEITRFWVSPKDCTSKKFCELTPNRAPPAVLTLRPPSGAQTEERYQRHVQSYRL